MLKKGSKSYSILKNKCPKCHEGNFFENKNPYQLKAVLKMKDYCVHCGFKFQIEPSFFYGAMYVSYALTVAISIITFVICYLLGFDLLSCFIGIIISLIVTTPLTLRLARLIYSNIFISYDHSYKNEEGLKALDLSSTETVDG